MVLGVHILDLCHDLLGEPSWCLSRVTAGGRPVAPADVRDGAEGIGPLAGDRVDALFGFEGTPAVAHFATARPKEPGGRFALTIFGSKGCIRLGTGWLPPAFLLRDASWAATGAASWTPITGAGPGQPETHAAGSPDPANRAIVADLIHAVETDTQPRTDAKAGRTAIEMVLACYASHGRGGLVALPLADRAVHPLSRLSRS
jgi:predicted dehydrogenase